MHLFSNITTATTISTALLLFTTFSAALPHPPQPQPQSVNDKLLLLLDPRQIKYDQFDEFWADWLRKQDQALGGDGGEKGDKVKREQVHFKKYADRYEGLLEARLKRLGRGKSE